MHPIIQVLRPYQYLKNLFIFLPLFFGLQLSRIDLLAKSAFAFVAFSLTASSIYILNDMLDLEEDRSHPVKSDRPLAAGRITFHRAGTLAVFLAALGAILMGLLSFEALGVLAIYYLINLAYCFKLKHIAIMDVVVIAVGFVLRLSVGSAITHIHLSIWIVVMTFLLALFLGLAKRRDDILIFINTGNKIRSVVDGYNLKFLDAGIQIMAAVVIVAYIMYTVSPEVVQRTQSDHLYLTAFFVIFGILRYLQIIFVEEDSGSPTLILLRDRFLQSILGGWAICFAWLIYG